MAEQGNEVSGTLKVSCMQWMAPVLQALKELGGSAKFQQVHDQIVHDFNLSQETLTAVGGKNKVNRFDNDLRSARNHLVQGGYIDNSVRGVWTITESGKTVDMNDAFASELIRANRKATAARRKKTDANNVLGDSDVAQTRYWAYRPGAGASKWQECQQDSVMMIGWGRIGSVDQFQSQNDIQQALQQKYELVSPAKNRAHALWQFANDMNTGDVIVAVNGFRSVLGIGTVQSDYEYQPGDGEEFDHLRQVVWTVTFDDGDAPEIGQQFANKTLTEITSDEAIQQINALFDDDELDDDDDAVSTAEQTPLESYSRADFLNEVYMDGDSYDRLVAMLDKKKNIILEGAPGVGKTFAAKRLAYSIMGEKDPSRVQMVQFHQSYSYEDFIMGFRPYKDGFELRHGVFYNFCKTAEADEGHSYFFIIDEINRGNLSKIFGELFMLIESDKRNLKLRLLYSDEQFSIPANVFIIGMMNTADRSLAMMDYALRRRFAFIDLLPGFDTDGFKAYQHSLHSAKFDRLIDTVRQLNQTIAKDESLGRGFMIGHSYFSNLTAQQAGDDQTLSGIVEYELIPLLGEYWFDDPKKVEDEAAELRNAIQ
ncbi:AAA family ATPase [Bifidobacterium sp. 82T10]|uniref:AAA family ATPase n=1 Tax=Bifidobacterium miconis TaxID=2834435 RepID=A0ABS6WBQ8_9BIFI|nr:AAA family ATPase [Bifidobacterium miconis]MBW3091485.1 AAA family ATPase [Bifidobacterium miconis]